MPGARIISAGGPVPLEDVTVDFPKTLIASQFARPRGPLGRIIGRGMARTNGDLSRWVVDQICQRGAGDARRIAELGPGPGVGLEALLARFDHAQVWGIDLSTTMLAQARRRNATAVAQGRLVLLEGGVPALASIAPLDLVMANHVLYFWHEPDVELAQIRRVLRRGGLLGLGYQRRQNMPRVAQREFVKANHLLYDSPDQVAKLLATAGFESTTNLVKGPPEAPHGFLTLAMA